MALLAMSCEVDLPRPNVLPDPALSESGLQKFQTVSIYESTDIGIAVERTYGLSKEITMDIDVDESLITDYNSLYNTQYKLMDAKYYSFPKSVTLAPDTQNAEVKVVVKTASLVTDVRARGEDPQNFLIPLRITGASMEIDDLGNMGSVLLGINLSEPTLVVDIPKDNLEELSFLSIAPIDQTVTLSADANFTTLDADRVAVEIDASKVTEFNTEHGTDYKVLPSNCFEVKKGVFDGESLRYSSDVVFKCGNMEDAVEYLCPLVLKDNAGYIIEQAEPVYVIASLTELKAWASDGGSHVTLPSYKDGIAEIQINAPMTEDIEVSFVYDESAVTAYNAAIGTSYKTFDPSLVKIEKSVIKAESKVARVSFSVDASALPYDGDESWAIALTVDKSLFPSGTVFTEGKQTVIIEINKTITGDYAKNTAGITWEFDMSEGQEVTFTRANQGGGEVTKTVSKFTSNETTYNSIQPTVYLTKGSSYDGQPQKYYIIYGGRWQDGIFLFNLSDTPDADGYYTMTDLKDRTADYDSIWDKSKFNPKDGSWEIQMAVFGSNVRQLFCILTR